MGTPSEHIQRILGTRVDESPQLIDQLRLALDKSDSNYVQARKLLKKVPYSKVVYTGTGGIPVRRYRNTMFAVTGNRVLYYAKLAQQSTPLGNGVYQEMVWRNTAVPSTVLLAGEVMLGYLLPEYKILLCDRKQTTGGQRLWLTVTATAIEKGHKVYLWHTDEFQQVYSAEFDIFGVWGRGKEFQDSRIIITL